ncbi:MAG: hypothetical protein Q7U10_05880 [Thermodesulfovibrionia bacterium]|nr:hypothetical protein [Thermodesulfovibrionia bacterium]
MIKDKQEIKDDKAAKEGKVDVSKRTFIKAAALGVVAAGAVFSTILISKSSDSALRKRVNTTYMNDDLQQDKVMSQKQLVLMTDEEKKQMLNEILHDYHVTA